MAYLTNLMIGFDQLANCIIAGEPDETLSSHAYRMDRDGKPWGFLAGVIDALFFWQAEHCYESYISEKERRQLLPEFRTA